jgi:hypothetical protein
MDHVYQPPSEGLVAAFGLDPDVCGECGETHAPTFDNHW